MPHPLVVQLRFARSELKRGLAGLTDADARRRFMPMNCISWNIGHLAWHEQGMWLFKGQGQVLVPELNDLFAYGAPACTSPLDEVWAAWNTVTQTADPWLDALTSETLLQPAGREGRPDPRLWGSLLQRMIYHYWYHIGESLAIRQMLGHTDLPQFVGNLDGQAPYRPN